MKLIMGLMAAAFAVSLTGCNQIKSGFQTENSLAVTSLGSLQGKVFDATTGQAISGTDLKITLIRGASDRNPDRLVTTATDPLAGEYAYTNIPVERASAASGNAMKIVVTKPGYHTFASEFNYDSLNTLNQLGNGAVSYNKIANIYLYPTTAVPGDVTIDVTDNFGAAIANGTTVQLVPSGAWGENLGRSNALLPTSVLPYISATTTAGKATFPKASLTLGANYQPVVISTGKFSSKNGTTILVGTDPYSQTIALSPANYAGLAVVAESTNGGTAAPVSTGILSMIFNEPFTLDSNFKWVGELKCTSGTNCVTPGALNGVSGVTAVTTTTTVTGSAIVFTPTLPTLTGVSGVSITYRQDTAGTGYGAKAYVTSTGVESTAVVTGAVTGKPVKISN